LSRKQADLKEKNTAIEGLTKSDDIDAELDLAEGYISRVQFAHDHITLYLSRVEKAVADARILATTPAPRPPPVDQLRLPKLEMPTFSGSYTEWTSYWDLFEASVNRNNTLTDSQKRNYLKASVKGDAARLIASLTVSDANYPVARQLLIDRYSNARAITRAHVHAICSHIPVKTEAVSTLRRLQTNVKEHILGLIAGGVDTDACDPFTVYIVADKLDAETRKQWELSSSGSTPQKLDDLLTFIDQRARALEASPRQPSEAKSDTKSDSNQRKHNNFHTSTERCVCCKQ
jgi:hypothetical protein